MTDDEELVGRLRKQGLLRITPSEGVVHGPINPDGPEAATRIEQLYKEVERLRAQVEAGQALYDAVGTWTKPANGWFTDEVIAAGERWCKLRAGSGEPSQPGGLS